MDVIDCTDITQILGAILQDIEKALIVVNHDFLLKVLNKFKFGENFNYLVKIMYSERKRFVTNNGFPMSKEIFQGCPISPCLFLLVIETKAVAIHQNNVN